MVAGVPPVSSSSGVSIDRKAEAVPTLGALSSGSTRLEGGQDEGHTSDTEDTRREREPGLERTVRSNAVRTPGHFLSDWKVAVPRSAGEGRSWH